MEQPATGYQSAEHLELLLEYLACPVDNSTTLAAVRNDDGAIIGLRSSNREYPVINGVPCMIPDLGRQRTGSQAVWRELQDSAWQRYQGGHRDVFSEDDDPLGRGVGQIVGQIQPGLYLDVGCGPLPQPAYMASSPDSVSWLGIDPYFGDAPRRFPFAQALGEYPPFRRHVFDGVLYAGVIDHVIDPLRSLDRARTIVKPDGKLFVWYGPRRVDVRYVVWKTVRKWGLAWRYNENHQWAFTERTLRALLGSADFTVEEVIHLCQEFCPEYASCTRPKELLVIAGCS